MNIANKINSVASSFWDNLCERAYQNMAREQEANYVPPVRHRRDPVIVPDTGLTRLTADEARRIVGREYLGNTTTTTLEHLSFDVDEIIDSKNFKKLQMEDQILRKTGFFSDNRITAGRINAYVVLDESEQSRVGSGLVSESNIALYNIPTGAYSLFEANK